MRKRWIIVALTIVFVVSSIALITVIQPINNGQQNIAESWMFKGAYATYQGQIDSLSTPYNIDETIQVTALNATHVQIQTNSSITTSFAPTLSDQTTLWVNKTNISFQPKGETLVGTYNTKIAVRSRDCIVYDYTNEAINATYYLDIALLWPVRVVYSTAFENQTYHIEFNLKDTNINGLN